MRERPFKKKHCVIVSITQLKSDWILSDDNENIYKLNFGSEKHQISASVENKKPSSAPEHGERPPPCGLGRKRSSSSSSSRRAGEAQRGSVRSRTTRISPK